MDSTHHSIFRELESLTFRELRSSERLIEIMRAKIGLLDPGQLSDESCARLARLFCDMIRDVLEDRYQEISIRAFAHICVALDYFLDPVERVPDAHPGGLLDDLQFMVQTEQRFHRDIQKYRAWRARMGQA
jgi:uncharacterized membrane protein YkvA (DUF1232 family)